MKSQSDFIAILHKAASLLNPHPLYKNLCKTFPFAHYKTIMCQTQILISGAAADHKIVILESCIDNLERFR